MDLLKIIHDLREEGKKLDQIIISLEQLNGGITAKATPSQSRRGRRSMDSDARLEVSRRMKSYWASRRASPKVQAAGESPAGQPSTSR